jgi:hypothetical protein
MEVESEVIERRNPKNRVKVAIRARPMVSRELDARD